MGESDRAIVALQKLLSIPYEGALASNVPLTPACSGSIRCSIRSGMIHASKNSAKKKQSDLRDFSAELRRRNV